MKLDSLRGVAACLVVLHHSNFSFGNEPFSFFSNSWLFVDFFFVLSGFVISHAYDQRIANGLQLTHFTFLRLARLYPLHVCILLAWIPYVGFKQYLFLNAIGGTEPFVKSNFETLFANLFLLHSTGVTTSLSWNFPSWSISAEFLTYLAYFALIALIPYSRNVATPFILALLIYSFFAYDGLRSLSITYSWGFVRCLAGFLLGVWLQRALRDFDKKIFNKCTCYFTLSIIEISILVLIFIVLSNANSLYSEYLVLGSFVLCILVFSVDNNGVIGELLLLARVRRVGVLSYSIYLTHALLTGLMTNIIEHIFGLDPVLSGVLFSLLINLVFAAVVLCVSHITYEYIELPAMIKAKSIVSSRYGKIEKHTQT